MKYPLFFCCVLLSLLWMPPPAKTVDLIGSGVFSENPWAGHPVLPADPPPGPLLSFGVLPEHKGMASAEGYYG